MSPNHLAIETTDLTRCFGELIAVDALNLKVPKGKIYGFLGANGAGKTTTIRMILGLIRANRGTIRLLGNHATDTGRRGRRRVGALVESPSIYAHLTGRENLEVTARLLHLDRSQIEMALEAVNLKAAADRRAGQYSLGMKQRLGLAQALIGEPELLILDEPTNGLDPAGIQEIRTLIRSLAVESGVTVFLSSHLLSEVEQVADAVGIIHQGRLLFEGGLGELAALSRPALTIGVDNVAAALRILRDAGHTPEEIGADFLRLGALEESEVADVNAMLVSAGVGVHHLSMKKPSLEDLFLSMTEAEEPQP